MTWFKAFLAWLAALLAPSLPTDDIEAARASAAVSVAVASMVADDAKPEPMPPKPDVCPDCKGTGWIVHGDGHRTPCPCGATPKGGEP